MTQVLLRINVILKSVQENIAKFNEQKLISLITELEQQLKQLEQHETYQYYYLISELYATKLYNVSKAYKSLQKFQNCYQNQVILQVQMRFSIYSFLQGKYSQAIQHFNNVLHLSQEDNQLKHKTQFFFQKFVNFQALQNLSNDKQNFNFQAKLILSIFYEFQQGFTEGVQLMSSCLSQQLNNFQKYQVHRRLLAFIQLLRSRQKSSIKISNKNIEQYKLFVQKHKTYQTQFQQKVQFLQKVLNLLVSKGPFLQNQYNQFKKLKFLAIAKIQKCIKLAKDKNVKLSLQQTLFSLKSLNQNQSQNQSFQKLINFDFVKSQSKGFECLKRIDASIKLIKQKFFDSLVNYTIQISQKKKNLKFKQPHISMIQTKKSSSQIIDQFDLSFTGSKMFKIHASSQGNEERYFYIKPDELIQKLRLYYTSDQKSKSSGDSYYSLKGLKKISLGKKTQALKRKDAAKFEDDKCFALVFTGQDKQRNFYVPDQQDYESWVKLIKNKILQVGGISKMKGTMAFSKVSTLKKSKKIVQI